LSGATTAAANNGKHTPEHGGKRIMKKFFAILICLAALGLSVLGCSAPPGDTAIGQTETVIDSLGREISLAAPPQRIVSLMPSKTEKLFALGLGDRVVGVTDMCDYPEDLERRGIARVGDAWNLSVEHIVALQPDLVVANWLPEGLDQQLTEVGIPVFVYAPMSVAEVTEGIRRLGQLTGRQEAARQITGKMASELETIAAAVARIGEAEKVRVLYLLDDFLFTAGIGTLQDEMVALAGGINVVEAAGWPQLNEEAFLAGNPDVILYTFPGGKEFLESNSNLRALDCVREGRVYKLDESLASRTGPRLVQGLAQIFSFLYPSR
jgi:iron complex transport system substrate-binding protein